VQSIQVPIEEKAALLVARNGEDVNLIEISVEHVPFVGFHSGLGI
jgi:hypothetical protein